MTEPDLIQRAKTDDSAAVAQLIDSHATRAYRLALHILGNKVDAEDATQNALVKAFTQLKHFEERSSFRTWLLSIVSREALNLLRARRSRLALWEHQAEVHDSEDSVESIVQVKAEHQAVWRAVNRLKDRDRMILTLSYFMGMSEAEAAVILGVKRGTVKSRKHHALGRLRVLVEREFPDLKESVVREPRRREVSSP